MSSIAGAVDAGCTTRGPADWELAETVDASNSPSSPPRIEKLNHLERLCSEQRDEHELWRCLAIRAASELAPIPDDLTCMYSLDHPATGWRDALMQLRKRRYELRKEIEFPGCDVTEAQDAADQTLADELNLCFDRLFQDEEPEDMATATKTKPTNKAKPAKSPPFDAESKSARTQRKFTAPPAPAIAAKMVIVAEVDLPLDRIKPSPENPREDWDEQFLRTLGESLRDNGQLTPLSVRTPDVDGVHELIDGETRWRAAKLIGLPTLRCSVIECTDAEAAMARVLSYRQRRDLNPIEEARGLKLLLEKYGCSQRELEQKVGISQGQISNRVRLLQLPKNFQQRVIAGELTATAARALAAWSDVPQLFAEIDREWKHPWSRDRLRQEPEQYVLGVLYQVSHALSGSEYTGGRYVKWKIDLRKLSPEQTAALELRDIPSRHTASTEQRAFNVRLADQLSGAAITAAKAKETQRAQGAEDKSKSPQLSAAEQKKRAAKLDDQFKTKLSRWLISWLQSRIVAKLPECSDQELLAFTMHCACADGAYHRLADLIDKAQLGKAGRSHRPYAAWTAIDPEHRGLVWTDLLAEWLGSHTEGRDRMVTPRDIVAIAGDLAIDVTKEWTLTEEFLELHTSGQLSDLAADWGVGLARGKRPELIAELLEFYAKKPCPKSVASLDPLKYLS